MPTFHQVPTYQNLLFNNFVPHIEKKIQNSQQYLAFDIMKRKSGLYSNTALIVGEYPPNARKGSFVSPGKKIVSPKRDDWTKFLSTATNIWIDDKELSYNKFA